MSVSADSDGACPADVDDRHLRARRRALRSVAKIIREMERQIQQNGAENGAIDQGGL